MRVVLSQGLRCGLPRIEDQTSVHSGPYRPQTKGEPERFIQSALRKWAYGIAYNDSSERAEMLESWTRHYKWHRPQVT